jgi:uncharacterized protein (DUF2062 family)
MPFRDKLVNVVKKRILGVEDTPHRIAFGVFLGFVVGFTPTMGLQIVIYLAMAALLRANKVSGIPIVFITNPFTAVPIYYAFWKLGIFVMHGTWHRPGSPGPIKETDVEPVPSLLHRLLELDYWIGLWGKIVNFGAELWVGSLVAGFLVGLIAYVVTYRMVLAYRKHKHSHEHESEHHR